MDSTFSSLVSQHLNIKSFISMQHLSSLIKENTRFRVFDPTTTLYCFIFQILSRCSCKGVIANLNVQRKLSKQKLVSMNTSAYTQAKKRLSESALRDIAFASGQTSDAKAKIWKWKERNVELIDGTVISLEDTLENKKKFPITYAKGKAQGQPKLRLLGRFSHSSGSLVDAELGKYVGKGQSETTLIQKMIDRIKPFSILVLDRFFTNYFLQAMFLSNNLDYVIRARDQFAKRHLGKKKNDIIVTIKKPHRSKHSNYDWDLAPEFIKVRLIKSTIKRKGSRVAKVYIITSLFEESKADVEELYLKRWGVELDIRNLKTTLEASLLRSKTPKMALKELWVSIIAYNLIRSITVSTSNIYMDVPPRKRSFKTTILVYLECIKSFGSRGYELIAELLKGEILNAKYRREPRAIKKRNNRYCHLTVSRKESKNQNWGYSRRCGKAGLPKQMES
ncbi:MAG: IS4 family transposase [Candidatus Brocadiales bacterium]|nr:IS4 family transposase [Candidatus Brocadiales bacterium]